MKILKNKKAQQQRGEGLMSFFLYIGLAAAVIGGYYGWKYIAESSTLNQAEIGHALAIQQCIKNNRDASGYANVTVASLQVSACLPSDMVGFNGGTLKSGFNQDVDFTTTSTSYSITFHQVPAKNCQPMANGLSLTSAGGFSSISSCSTTDATDLVLSGT